MAAQVYIDALYTMPYTFSLKNRNDGYRELSPAYDINPNEDGLGLSLNINETHNSLNLDLAMEVHDYFRFSESEAPKTIKEVK